MSNSPNLTSNFHQPKPPPNTDSTFNPLNPFRPCGQVQKDEDGHLAAMVALYPEIKLGDDEEIFTECIFLIDRSGSMGGSRINQVRDAMQIFLRSLGEGTMVLFL